MATKLKIEADLRQVKDSFKDLRKEIDSTLGKKYTANIDLGKVEKLQKTSGDLFQNLMKQTEQLNKLKTKASKNTESALKSEQKEINSLRKELRKYEEDLERINDLKASGNSIIGGEGREKELKDKIANVKKEYRERTSRQKDLHRMAMAQEKEIEKQRMNVLRKQEKILNSKGGGIGGFLSRAGARASQAGHMGIGSALGGLAKAAGPAAMIAGGAMAAYGGLRAVTAPRRQLAGMNLELQRSNFQGARSNEEMAGIRRAGLSYGFGADEAIQTATQIQQNVGQLSRGQDGRNELANILKLQATTGFDVAGAMGTTRSVAAGKQDLGVEANLKKTEKMFARAVTSAFDQSGALRYLEATAEFTDQMANEGTADVNAINSAMTSLAGLSDFFKTDANRTTAALGGLDQGFQANTGLAIRAISQSAGAGEMGPAQMLALQETGLFGMSGSQFEKNFGKDVNRGEVMTNFIKSIGEGAGLMGDDGNLKLDSKENRAAMALALKESGIKNMESAFELTDAFSKSGQSLSTTDLDSKQVKDILEGKGKSEILSTTDQAIVNQEAQMKELLITVGDKLYPVMKSIDGTVIKLANHILGIEDKDKDAGSLKSEAETAEKVAQQRSQSFGGSMLEGAKSIFGMETTAEEATRKRGLAASKILQSGGSIGLGKEAQALVTQANEDVDLSKYSRYGAQLGKKRTQEKIDMVKGNMEMQQNAFKTRMDKLNLAPEERERQTKDFNRSLNDEKALLDQLKAAFAAIEENMNKRGIRPLGN